MEGVSERGDIVRRIGVAIVGVAAFRGDVLKTRIPVGGNQNVRVGKWGVRDLVVKKILKPFGHCFGGE